MSDKNKFEIEQVGTPKTVTYNRTTTQEVASDLSKFYNDIAVLDSKVQTKVNKISQEREEARRKVSLANKRLRRLEELGLTESPAYKATGGKYFSVKGKTQVEIQSLIREMDKFIEAKTSTVRGINAYSKEMAENTGVKYKNLKDLQQKIPVFFELSSKIEQYLRHVEDMASAIDYNQIWQSVNVYVKNHKIDLAQARGDVEGMVANISQAIKEYEETIPVSGEMFRLKK